jgi:hypothetical protein
MIKLIDLLNEDIGTNPKDLMKKQDEQYKEIYSGLTDGQKETIKIAWKNAGDNFSKRGQVINNFKKYKKQIQEELINLRYQKDNKVTEIIQTEINDMLKQMYDNLYKKYQIKSASPISQAIHNFLDNKN